MNFTPNKTPVEIISEGAFGGTYFRDIYSVLMANGIEIVGKNLIFQKILILSFVQVIIMMLGLINTV